MSAVIRTVRDNVIVPFEVSKEILVLTTRYYSELFRSFWQVSTGGGSASNEVAALEFQASQVISRLEEAVERAADGGGTTWNNPSGFLSQPKTSDEILTLIQVNIALAEIIDWQLVVSLRFTKWLVDTIMIMATTDHVVIWLLQVGWLFL